MKFQTEYASKYQSLQPKQNNDSNFATIKKSNLEEPFLQKKKRVPLNHEPLTLGDGTIDQIEKKSLTASQPVVSNEQTKPIRSLIKDDQFILLGPQDKFTNSINVPYALRNPVKSIIVQEREKKVEIPKQEKVEEAKIITPRDEDVAHKSKVSKSPNKIKKHNKKSFLKFKNQAIQTAVKPAPHVKVDTGAVQEIVPANDDNNKIMRNVPMSEYQKSFIWSTKSKNTPIVNASIEKKVEKENHVIEEKIKPHVKVEHNIKPVEPKEQIQADSLEKPKNDSEALPQKKSEKLRFTSEYKSRFSDVLHEQLKIKEYVKKAKPVEEKNSVQVQVAEKSPQKPAVPHTKLRRWKSEYQNSFKPFWKESEKKTEVIIKDATKPELSEWFKNIIELRKKVQEYKTRSYGVNFSSEHMAQLESNTVSSWDIESTASSDNSNKQVVKVIDKRDKLPIKRSRSAEPLNVEVEINHETKPQYEDVKIVSENIKQPLQVITQNNNNVFSTDIKSSPLYRLVNNLDSVGVKQQMAWDEGESYQNNNYLVDQKSFDKVNTDSKIQLIDEHSNLLAKAKEKSHKINKNENKIEPQQKNRGHMHHKCCNNHVESPKEHSPLFERTKLKENNNNSPKLSLKTINENYGQTYVRQIDDDLESLSQFSTRSLASSSSLLDRAKGNREKFWGKRN